MNLLTEEVLPLPFVKDKQEVYMPLCDAVRFLLGKGTYGNVYEVEIDGKPFAEKQYHFDTKSFLKDELHILTRLQKDRPTHVVRYVTCNPKRCCLYFELLPRCTSSTVYHRVKNSLEDLNKFINCLIHDMACALKYLESKGVVHMDLKQDNIMCRTNGKFVLIDFGMAQLLDAEGQVKDRDWDFPPSGAYIFQSPEVLQIMLRDAKDESPSDLYFTANHDIYSLGLLAYFFASNQTYWNSSASKTSGQECFEFLLNVINTRRRLKFLQEMKRLEECNIEAASLIQKMLEPDVRKRLYACEVYEECFNKN